MKRKTAAQRAKEFANKAVIKKKIGGVKLTAEQTNKLEQFFEKYLKTYTGEIADSVYGTLYNLLIYRTDASDLFDIFQRLKQLNAGEKTHYLELYGNTEGIHRYNQRNKLVSEGRRLKDSQKVDAFLRKKCVSSILKKSELTTEQLLELETLLMSREYSEFNDNESIIIDLVLNFKPDFVSRYDTVKKLSHTDIEYFKARYANNFVEKYAEYKEKKTISAKNNFANCKEYWQARGYSDISAGINAHNIQKYRALKAATSLRNRASPRTIEFWIDKGYNTSEAIETVRKIQARDLDFYITNYGEEIGHYKYQSAIQKRLVTWFKKELPERNKTNASKGRTYLQLVDTYGEDAANSIIENRLKSNPAISNESKIFFQALDKMLGTSLEKASVTGYKGPERWVRAGKRLYFLDYVLENCIIEYNGSYWHGDPRLFQESDWHSGKRSTVKEIWNYDKEKLDNLTKLGYNVLTVWSYDVNEDLQTQLNKCKDYLLEHVSHSD